MNTFLLSFDANTTITGMNPPTLEILVGGVVVSSVEMVSGATSYDIFVEYTGTAPSTLSVRFAGSSGSAGDSINFTSMDINGTALNLGTDLTATMLAQAQSSAITAANDLFGHVTPTTGAPTITGDGTDEDLRGDDTTADIIDGLAGNDRIYGFGNDDEILGGAGNDSLFGQSGDDTILGGAGDDFIMGNEDNDTLFGEGDNDTIIAGAGDDIVNGGAGNDGLVGEAGNDVMFGEDGDDWMIGGAGNDILIGDDGNDFIVGGADNDALSGGDGTDQLIGGTGNDLLAGGAGDDELIGEAGTDTLEGGAGDDDLYGGDGADVLHGGSDNDALTGGDGADELNGDDGADTLNGGAGADTLNGGAGNDILHGHGLDAETISDILFNNPNVTYSEDTGSFYQFVSGPVSWTAAQTAASTTALNGVNGHLVTITSAAENNVVYQLGVDNGADSSTGGSGNRIWLSATDNVVDQDWFWTSGLEAGIQFSSTSTATNNFFENWGSGQPNNSGGAQTRATIWFNGGGDDDTWDDRNDSDNHDYVIEWEGGLFSDDNAIDTIDGGTGDDWIYGYGGADILDGGTGSDVIFGGAGADTINGDADSDTIIGGAGADIIDGGAADDFIMLANGDFAAGESLTGDAGTDEIKFTNDTTVDFTTGTIATIENLTGFTGNDTVTVSATQFIGFTNIDLNLGTDILNVQATGVEDISGAGFPTVSNVETGNLTGSTGADDLTLTAAQLDAILTATGTIAFAGGADIMRIDGTSADLNTLGAIDGSITGLEEIDASTAAAATTIDLNGQSEDLIVTGGGSGDTLTTGSGDDNIDGGSGNDILSGGAGIDTINGGLGGDTINGGADNDIITDFFGTNTLNGDGGNDTITAGSGTDLITGGTGIDIIDGNGGDDNIFLANGDFAAGESITGDTGTDRITLTNATTVDFTTGTINTIERVIGSTGDDNVTMSATLFGELLTVDLDGGTDILNVQATGTEDISGGSLPTVSNVETGNLTGSAGADDLTLTAAQLDAIITGAGTIALDGGTDVIRIDGTSADINSLGGTDGSISGLEEIDASSAAAAVTIDLNGQTEGFTVTTAAGDDVITTGSGADTINGGSGSDTIDAGDGNDIINGGNQADFITGGGGIDTINGESGADRITGGTGADILIGGGGNDRFFLNNGDFAAGESIAGDGGGSDRIQFNDATTVDFTTGTITGMERVLGSGGDDNVTLSATLFESLSIFDLNGGTDVVNVFADNSDISAGTLPTISDTETGNLTGDGGNNSITLTGAQLDSIIIGAGVIALGAGASDVINITSTSADLNTLGGTDGDITGVEAISAATAGAGVTIDLNAQSEGFTITGSASADTLTTGSGADTINSGAGDDVITSGAGADIVDGEGGDDTFNLANGDFTAGETIDGGADTDEVVFTNATTLDFTAGGISNVEVLTGSNGADIVTISGTQLNDFTSIDFNGGADVLNLTSTSTGLNALADGALSDLETIDVSSAVADVTLDLTAQSENFTITGSSNTDVLRTGSGTDTINSGSTLSATISTILTANPEAILTTSGAIIHVYDNSGSFTFTAPTGITSVDFLAVGGGGWWWWLPER